MENDEYIRLFLKKHNYDGNIIVNTRFKKTWDNVVSIICNEKDIPSKRPISIDDIQYDILSDLPKDLFFQWIEECNDNTSYKKWITERNILYIEKNIDLSGVNKFKEKIEESIDKLFDKIDDNLSSYIIAGKE